MTTPEPSRQKAGDGPVAASRAVLAIRERELLDIKGPCFNPHCRLHYAHDGPCDTTRPAPVPDTTTGETCPDSDGLPCVGAPGMCSPPCHPAPVADVAGGLDAFEGWVCQSCAADNFIPAGYARTPAADVADNYCPNHPAVDRTFCGCPADVAGDVEGFRRMVEDWLHDGRWPEPYDLSHAILASDWLAARDAAVARAASEKAWDEGYERRGDAYSSFHKGKEAPRHLTPPNPYRASDQGQQ